MKEIRKQFIIRLIIVFLLANAAMFGIYSITGITPIKGAYLLVAFFFLVTFLSFRVVAHTDLSNSRKFNTRFILSFGIRFFAYLIFALVYLLVAKPEVKQFLLIYFVLYIVFTTLEMISLARLSRTSKIK